MALPTLRWALALALPRLSDVPKGGALMYCGPLTVAAITGWTRDQVWLHIRALREQRGERVTRHPRGGTMEAECFDALTRAGYAVSSPWPRVDPMRYGEFAKGIGRTGMWICGQTRHVFAHTAGTRRNLPRLTRRGRVFEAKLNRVYRVERISGHSR